MGQLVTCGVSRFAISQFFIPRSWGQATSTLAVWLHRRQPNLSATGHFDFVGKRLDGGSCSALVNRVAVSVSIRLPVGGEAMAAQAFSEEHHDSEILSDQPPCRSCGGGGC
jgi:hypothetical protein